MDVWSVYRTITDYFKMSFLAKVKNNNTDTKIGTIAYE